MSNYFFKQFNSNLFNSTMSFKEKHSVVSRQPSLPPLSHRTLHHPSFHPLYLISGGEHQQRNNQTVHPIITPAEFFYTDPTMRCGRRVPNLVSGLEFLDCFRLNTPMPRMSTCQAQPVRPDPFRSGPYPVTDLGSLTLKIGSLHSSEQPNRLVLQLTQEEDDLVTNLLKLHHQEPAAFSPLLPSNEGRCWSDSELEAANTLLNGFGLMEDDEMWSENDKKSESPDLPVGSQTFSEFIAPSSPQNGIFSNGEDDYYYVLLSASEGDAINVLLSLGVIPESQ